MKIFVLIVILTGFAFNSYATNPISPEAIDFEKTIKVDKKINKIAKRLSNFSKTKLGKMIVKKYIKIYNTLNKRVIDLQDPVNKWLWFGIFGIVGSTIFLILASSTSILQLSYIAMIILIAGLVCFWYWVYLKFLQ